MKRWANDPTRKAPAAALIDQIFESLVQQSVVVPGAKTVQLITPRVATQSRELNTQRAPVATEVKAVVDVYPCTQVLLSLPGVGIKTAATLLLDAEDFCSFPVPTTLRLMPGSARPPDALRLQGLATSLLARATSNSRTRYCDPPGSLLATPHIQGLLRQQTRRGQIHNAAVIHLVRHTDSTSSLRWSATAASTKLFPTEFPERHDNQHRYAPNLHSNTIIRLSALNSGEICSFH